MLMSLAGGKVVCCLEVSALSAFDMHLLRRVQGGYNLDAISNSALAVTRTLMGEPPDRIRANSPTKSGLATVQKVALIQSEYWHCLRPKNVGKRTVLVSIRLHLLNRSRIFSDAWCGETTW